MKKLKTNQKPEQAIATKITTYINLEYLNQRTKSNPVLMTEMISVYLDQTPPLIATMKQSLATKEWDSLRAAAHKMVPSFAIMGISPEFENMAKKVQEYSGNEKEEEAVAKLVLQLENICASACLELEKELNRIKNTNR